MCLNNYWVTTYCFQPEPHVRDSELTENNASEHRCTASVFSHLELVPVLQNTKAKRAADLKGQERTQVAERNLLPGPLCRLMFNSETSSARFTLQ